jgi:GNAT acetyltransferase-like protein
MAIIIDLDVLGVASSAEPRTCGFECPMPLPNPDPPIVRIIRTIQELEQLREVWDSWCDDPNADLDNYLAFARCQPNFVRGHVMVVYRDGRPDCVLVGRLERCRLKLKIAYTTVFEPTISRLFFVQGGFLGNQSEENSSLLTRELRHCLHRGEADYVEFTRLTKDSSLYRTAESEFNVLQRGHCSPLNEHRWVELPGSFKEFLQNLSRKNRHELRRHENRLADDFPGRAQIRCYRDEDEVNELAQEVEKVSSKTYQRALGVGFQPGLEVLESLRTTARKGGLRGYVLYLNRRPAAFFVAKHYKKTLHGVFMGFDPQFGKYSPGLLVLMRSIEECFDPNTRASQIDLGWGDREFKRVLCNQSKQDGPVYLYAMTWAGFGLNLIRSSTSLLDLAARRMVNKSPFLQRLKKALQNRVRRSRVNSLGRECLE